MLPRKPFRREPPPRDEHRVNERIRVPRVRLVDEHGVMLGEMSTDQARQIARERGYDLVEVAADSRPPVCKLLDYGKYKYEQKKKQHKSKAKQHVQKVKEVRLRPLTDEHDLATKIKKAKEILSGGDKVLITVFFRGREMSHKDIGLAKMGRIRAELEALGRVEHDVTMTGPRMQMTMLPKPAPKGGKAKAPPAGAPPPQAPSTPAGAPTQAAHGGTDAEA